MLQSKSEHILANANINHKITSFMTNIKLIQSRTVTYLCKME